MEEAGKNSEGNDMDKCSSIINHGNNLLSLIIKILTIAYHIGVFCSSLIFIFYFIYIKYIPNVKTAFILDGLVFVLLLGLFLVLLFVAMGFPGIYYLWLNGDNNIKEKEKRVINNENSINASRKKFIWIITISTFLYVLINLFLINSNTHSQFFIWSMIIIVPIIFSITVSYIISNKNLEEYDHKKYLILILILLSYLVISHHNLTVSLWIFFISLIAITISTNIFRLKSFLSNLFVNFFYFLIITIFLAGLFSTILIFLNIKYTKFPTYNLYYLSSIYIVIPLIFASFSAFFNSVTFDITALIKNRNNIYYLKKHAVTDILIPLVVSLLCFFEFNLYTFPFNYFKLGSFEKNVIVNKYGYSILRTAGYPCKYIYSYTNNNSACSKPDKCFKVKTFILSDIGSNIYLESKVYGAKGNKSKSQKKNKLFKNKYIRVLIPRKDFLFLSYKNKLAKNRKTNKIRREPKK